VTGNVPNLNSNVLVEMLTVTRVEVLQGVCDVESTPSPERVAVTRSDNVRDTVRNGVRMDAKRQH